MEKKLKKLMNWYLKGFCILYNINNNYISYPDGMAIKK